MNKLTLKSTKYEPEIKNKKLWFFGNKAADRKNGRPLKSGKCQSLKIMTWNQYKSFGELYKYWCEIPEFEFED